MSLMKCEECDRSFDTDQVEMETFPCGDDDHFIACPTCAARINAERDAEMSAAKRAYDRAPLSERDPEQYRQDMVDAGREHLLPEYAERMHEKADMDRKRRREEPSA